MENKIELVSWSPMGVWSYNIQTDECQICKMLFVQLCIECSETNVKGEISCLISQGQCGHYFHKHCIDKYIASSKAPICPICITPYSTKLNDIGNNSTYSKLIKK